LPISYDMGKYSRSLIKQPLCVHGSIARFIHIC